jgi:hypothetical protein
LKLEITQKVIKMTEKESKEVKDLATEAAILSLIPEETLPCKDQDKACTKRWLESLSDCA